MADQVQIETTVRRKLFAPNNPTDRREPTARDQRTDIPARASWSYHDRKGWTMIDRVVDVAVTPESLAAARFSGLSTWTLGSADDACHAEVYPSVPSANNADELVVFTAGHRQYQILCNGLPALLDVLQLLKDIGVGEAKEPETPPADEETPPAPPAPAARRSRKK